ncbi:MAG TPA: response regulator [Acidimicrobiales bacterium]|nr:response regulator [Acidimicrobiales bacterium]
MGEESPGRASLYRRLVEGANVGVWVLDPDGRTTFANAKAADILGYPEDEMAALSLFDVLDEQGRAQAARNLERRRHGAAAQLECAFLRRDGSRVWVLVNTGPLCDDDGGYLGAVTFLSEITERKHIEEALERATARSSLLEAMATAANDASSVAAVLSTAVDAICAHTGWPVGHAFVPAPGDAELLVSSGIWHVDASGDDYRSLRTATAATTFRAGDSVVGGRLRDARPVWVPDVTRDRTHRRAAVGGDLGVRAHVAVPVRVGAETVAVLEFFSPDVLPADAGLLATLDRVGVLLGRVAERERASSQLAAARDQAMESSRAKSEFLATMSHEIRTPMNAVIGLTGLLLRTELDSRQREYTEGVHGAGEALLAIINDILDFSKIEAGKVELEVVDFDVVQLVEEVAGLVADAARGKDLELAACCHPDLVPTLRGDPARLRQVLLNLAANAVKFTDHGEVVVRAREERDRADGVVLRFEVADTGPGISPGDQKRLFEPFSQGDASTTRRFGGTGLGLAISTRLVAAMGGEIGVDSEPGRGSTFWFTVPVESSTSGPVAPPASHHLLDGLPVLVVDDNETNRVILREQLTAWDMRPTLAGDGASALRILGDAARAGAPFGLVLLDMCMPGMDGLDVARRIAADPATAGARVALLTSTSEVGAAAAAAAGVAACLTKPVRLSQLHDALVRLVAPETALRRPTAPVAGRGTPGARGHVLVVEDNATNQMVAVGLLEAMGYTADVVADGLEALHALDRGTYVAVLMDCQMPHMDGYTATRHIRRRPRDAGIPVIAMTAGAVAGDRERCLEAGMDDYITKPVKPDELEAALARWALPVPDGAGAGDGNPPAGPRGDGDDDGVDAGGGVDAARLELLWNIGPADGSLLAAVVDAFVAHVPKSLGDVTTAVTAGDGPGLVQAAHRLKGGAANLGMAGVASICAELERLGEAGRLDGARPLLDVLEEELERAPVSLRRFLAAGPPIPGR